MDNSDDLARRVEKDIADLQRYLRPLESGQMQVRERRADGEWGDITKREIERRKGVIATLQGILTGVKEKRQG
jgi:hypothetical protein